jgi:hypothetical protein
MPQRPRGSESRRRHSAAYFTRRRERGSAENRANMNRYLKEINEIRMPNSERNKRNMNRYLKNINAERSRGGATRRRRKH